MELIERFTFQINRKEQTESGLGRFLKVFFEQHYSAFCYRKPLKRCKYLCRPLYNAQAQVLRHNEGGGRPGGDAVWDSQRYLCWYWITAQKRWETWFFLNLKKIKCTPNDIKMATMKKLHFLNLHNEDSFVCCTKNINQRLAKCVMRLAADCELNNFII